MNFFKEIAARRYWRATCGENEAVKTAYKMPPDKGCWLQIRLIAPVE